MDLSWSDRSKSDGSDTWKLDTIKKEILILDPTDKYTYWLIPKFTLIAKETRLTPKRLRKMIMREGMTAQENKIFIKMLYNRKAILAWDFTEMGKVRKKVAFL